MKSDSPESKKTLTPEMEFSEKKYISKYFIKMKINISIMYIFKFIFIECFLIKYFVEITDFIKK